MIPRISRQWATAILVLFFWGSLSSPSLAQPEEVEVAAWAWLSSRNGERSRALKEDDLRVASVLGVRRVWLSVGAGFAGQESPDPRFGRLFRRALEIFPRVGMLMGEAGWIGRPQLGRERVRRAVVWFWANFPSHRLEINLDVEPQQLGEWQQERGREELVGGMVEAVCGVARELKLLEPDATLIVSLNLSLMERYRPGLGEELAHCGVDGIALMDYRRELGEMLKVVDKADCAKFLPYWLGVNLRPEAPARFGGRVGKRALVELSALLAKGAGSCFRGVAIHSLNYLSPEQGERGGK